MTGVRAAIAALALLMAATATATARPAYVLDLVTGDVLHAHDADVRWHPASLTKLMTTYLALDAIATGAARADSPVTFSATAIDQPFNTMGWPAGTAIDLDLAIALMIVKSGNDVAAAVGETLAGDKAAFVARMNATAARLGMETTRFVNANGLHDAGHYTTARDMGRLAQALLADFPAQAGYFSLREATARGERHTSFNPLFGRVEGADGMKTGYVCESGYNIVGTATRGGRRVVAVVLGALSEAERAEQAASLIEAGLARTGPSAATGAPGGGPHDMRPYTCGGQPLPAELAPYGPHGD